MIRVGWSVKSEGGGGRGEKGEGQGRECILADAVAVKQGVTQPGMTTSRQCIL